MSDRVATGIEGFDQLLYGGLPKGRTCLLAGEPGTGKSTFALQYLMEGAKNGEKCVYISIDEKPEHILADTKSLGWDLEPYLANGTFKVLDVTKYFSASKFAKGDPLNALQIIDDIQRFILKEEVTRLVIDPVYFLRFSSMRWVATSVSVSEIKRCPFFMSVFLSVR